MLYFAYLDEFGHIGPYISRTDKQFNDSPVFGLGGYIIPYDKVRQFGTFFYQIKCSLLAYDIKAAKAKDPSTNAYSWEKKGSQIYATRNVTKYRELRVATNRIIKYIKASEGALIYNGVQKTRSPQNSNALGLYLNTFSRSLQTINSFAASRGAQVVVVMDEHEERTNILVQASRAMYRREHRRKYIAEPPFQVESERFQTIQCADWLCGLYGRMGALRARPDEWSENDWYDKYFAERVDEIAWKSSLKLDAIIPPEGLTPEVAVAVGSPTVSEADK